MKLAFVNPNNWKSGIYKIVAPNGYYIYGSTNNFERRCYREHFYELERNNHSNSFLQNVFNKHKDEKWTFEAIEFVEPVRTLLLEREQVFLSSSIGEKSMNINKDANKPPVQYGKQKKETIEKRALKLKGKKRSEEQKKRIALSKINRHHTPEAKEKIRQYQLSKPPRSLETRQKISEHRKRYWALKKLNTTKE